MTECTLLTHTNLLQHTCLLFAVSNCPQFTQIISPNALSARTHEPATEYLQAICRHINLLQNAHELLHNAHKIAMEYLQAICSQFSKTFNFHMVTIYPNYITGYTLTHARNTCFPSVAFLDTVTALTQSACSILDASCK